MQERKWRRETKTGKKRVATVAAAAAAAADDVGSGEEDEDDDGTLQNPAERRNCWLVKLLTRPIKGRRHRRRRRRRRRRRSRATAAIGSAPPPLRGPLKMAADVFSIYIRTRAINAIDGLLLLLLRQRSNETCSLAAHDQCKAGPSLALVPAATGLFFSFHFLQPVSFTEFTGCGDPVPPSSSSSLSWIDRIVPCSI